MSGASLHASTDDETGTQAWSRAGLGLALASLTALLASATWRLPIETGSAAAGLLLLIWAGTRLALASKRLPPPAVTGVALSNLHLVDAGVCLIAAPTVLAAPAAALVLTLFWFSRRLLVVFPPS